MKNLASSLLKKNGLHKTDSMANTVGEQHHFLSQGKTVVNLACLNAQNSFASSL
jgi:hypothetical protein